MFQRISRLDDGRFAVRAMERRPGKRTLIVGAGDAGEKTYRELQDNPRLQYKVLGFVDHDPKKRGRTIHGVPVLGDPEDLPELVARLKIEEVLIAVPSATGSRVVMEKAVEHGVERFVLVSTDKAVRPTNVMGTSKRVAELILQAVTRLPTLFTRKCARRCRKGMLRISKDLLSTRYRATQLSDQPALLP